MSGCGAVIAAAGASRRMGALDKTTWPLLGQPVISWVLQAFEAVPEIAEIVIVTSEGNAVAVRRAAAPIATERRVVVCGGGDTRRESVAAGVAQLSPSIDLVLIHDAARPLVTPALLEAGLNAGRAWGAAIAAIPIVDTIKRIGRSGEIVATVDRTALYAAQTPQVFRRDWLETAYRSANDAPVATDEACLLEAAGIPVHVYPGSPENLKLTNATDLLIAEAILSRRVSAGCAE